jgi:cbb3-type cytochrome oxidase subunit 3
MISGTITAVLIVSFLGIFVWAYTPGRKRRFEEAAALALVDDVRAEERTP